MLTAMKKVTDIFSQKKRTFSLELFPPRTPEGYVKLLQALELFAKLQPDFISCTYGAGGGSREKTLDIVEHIQKAHHIPAIAHLTCVLNTKDQIRNILSDIKSRGIQNVLALRGDPPADDPNWQPAEDHFHYAYELCDFIKTSFPDAFAIGVAGFPEGHIACPDKEQDIAYLKMKIDAGGQFIMTQLFFDNHDYFDYVKRLRALKINCPVLPGILPITDYHGMINFCKRCGTKVPDPIHRLFSSTADDKDATVKKGIDLCIKQCRDLLSNGAPGIHFYPLNKIHPLDAIIANIKDAL